jgi:hypothetical protein
MAYNGNWINQLVPSAPEGTETKSLGDDSIRELKRAITNSFPNAVEAEAQQSTFGEVDAAVAAMTPRGVVVAWAGAQTGANVEGPPGWTIADGRPYRTGGGTTPDLSGKFILGARSENVPTVFWPPLNGGAGGNTEIDIKVFSSGQYKTYATSGVTLTPQQVPPMPAHSHKVVANASGTGTLTGSNQINRTDGGDNDQSYELRGGSTAATLGETSEEGGSGNAANAHNHTLQIKADYNNLTYANLPPYYALLYIIKD